MVYEKYGNLLDADVNYICHQVNCQGKMGSGIAKQIRQRFPAVYDLYMKEVSEDKLGNIQCVYMQQNESHVIGVINMFSQKNYGYDSRRYTSYDAFYSCLEKIKNFVPKGSKIGFPGHIGCGLGGADWEVIKTMISQVLGKDYEVYIYNYGGALG
jgi:O-acetyl-ADP-ribose deacetylase (regulator of RNase III)